MNDSGSEDRSGIPSPPFTIMVYVQWWLGVRREDGTGEVGRADGDAGASFGGNVTQSKKGRGI